MLQGIAVHITIMSQEMEQDQWKSHKFCNFDVMIHTIADLYHRS